MRLLVTGSEESKDIPRTWNPRPALGRERERVDAKEEYEETAGQVISVADALPTSLSENTRTAYRRGWQRFAAYCERAGRDPMAATPEDVAGFLVTMASEPRSPRATTGKGEPLALGTIRIFLAAINRKYREQNRSSPASDLRVGGVLRGLGRLSKRQQRQVKALREYEIATILAHCDELSADARYRAIATRDAAVLAVGFAGALRRSEICSLQVGDIEFQGAADEAWGMFLHIRRSKTDQAGKGQKVPVPEGELIRPVKRMRRWLAVSGDPRGPAFRTMRRSGHLQRRAMHPCDIARLVKRYVSAIGLDPSEYSGHSLRAGFVTSAAVHSARLDKIMEVTRHTSAGMVLRYIRQADAFENHAGKAFL